MRSQTLRRIAERAVSLRASIIRAGIFALAWAIFPFWFFVPVALYLYFVPSSQSKSVAIPFFALVALSAFEPANFYFALILGILFWCILLIKELYVVDRKSVYEALVLALTFLLLRIFYIKMGGELETFSLFYGFVLAGGIAWLFASFIKNFSPHPIAGTLLRHTATWIVFFLSWQLIIVGLFLPLDFIYQSVIVFLGIVAAIELFSQYLFKDFYRIKVLTTASVIFTVLALTLGSARWGL